MNVKEPTSMFSVMTYKYEFAGLIQLQKAKNGRNNSKLKYGVQLNLSETG